MEGECDTPTKLPGKSEIDNTTLCPELGRCDLTAELSPGKGCPGNFTVMSLSDIEMLCNRSMIRVCNKIDFLLCVTGVVNECVRDSYFGVCSKELTVPDAQQHPYPVEVTSIEQEDSDSEPEPEPPVKSGTRFHHGIRQSKRCRRRRRFAYVNECPQRFPDYYRIQSVIVVGIAAEAQSLDLSKPRNLIKDSDSPSEIEVSPKYSRGEKVSSCPFQKTFENMTSPDCGESCRRVITQKVSDSMLTQNPSVLESPRKRRAS